MHVPVTTMVKLVQAVLLGINKLETQALYSPLSTADREWIVMVVLFTTEYLLVCNAWNFLVTLSFFCNVICDPPRIAASTVTLCPTTSSMRSGNSIAACSGCGRKSHSKADFTHRLYSIANKKGGHVELLINHSIHRVLTILNQAHAGCMPAAPGF